MENQEYATINEADSLRNPLVSWESQEFESFEKGKFWYIGYVAFFAAIIGYYAVTRQWTSVGVFAVLAGVMYKFSHLKPKLVRCEIFEPGIRYHDQFYSYVDIAAFAISYDGPQRFLQIFVAKKSGMALKIHFDESVDVALVKEILVNHIPERAVQEDYIDKFSRFLKI